MKRMELRVEPINIVFSVVMVAASFTLTIRWLMLYDRGDAFVVLSAMVLIGALAALLLNINQRLKRIESEIELKERSLRINLQSIEGSVDKKLNTVVHKVNETMDESSRRMYR